MLEDEDEWKRGRGVSVEFLLALGFRPIPSPGLIKYNLDNVQPLSGPTGLIFAFDPLRKLKNENKDN